MAKRASTDYSFVIAIDKPAGMTSHDVVNRVRRIYGERRVGHTGTLDPEATGVLVVCVGPATRLDKFMVGHSKTYDFSIVFGTQTSTDDAAGEVISTEAVSPQVCDPAFAQDLLTVFVGPQEQLPPAYSAIKVDGQKAYDAARKGKPLNLEPRKVDVYSLELQSLDAGNPDAPIWHVRAHVSAGTYVRSLARDIGHTAGTCAHVGNLRRIAAGKVRTEDCVSLEALEASPFAYLLDPVKLLDLRFAFLEDGSKTEQSVAHGAALSPSELQLFEYDRNAASSESYCVCTSGVVPAPQECAPGETIALIAKNKLVALYEYDQSRGQLKSACGFSIGVKRGSDI